MSVHPQVKMVWKNLAPPRVVFLVWFILLGRLSTKDRLSRFNCRSVSDLNCVLCSTSVESVANLIFTCPATWFMWYKCFQWWGVNRCYRNYPIMFFKAWEGETFWGFERKLWLSLMYVVLWTIWRIRNKIIFEHQEPNWELESLMVKTRLGYWATGWSHDLPFSANQFVNNLEVIQKCVGTPNRGEMPTNCWLKFKA